MTAFIRIPHRILSSIIDGLEAIDRKKPLIFIASIAVVTTIGLWFIRLKYGSIWDKVVESSAGTEALTIGALVSPFAATYCIGRLTAPNAPGKTTVQFGPMAGYFQIEKSSVKWRLVVAGVMVAFMNCFLIMTISGKR